MVSSRGGGMFRLLGPVAWTGAGDTIDLGPVRQRTVLAALLVDAGQLVPAEALAERVWEADERPADAVRVLYAYASRIRRIVTALGPDAGPVDLIRRAAGYVLEIDRDLVDAHRFHRLVGSSEASPDRAARLRQALDLWRGPALADIPGAWAERVRAGWTRSMVDAAVAWAGAEVDRGHPDEVIVPLRHLADEHPLAEPLAEALIRALAAAGREAEALDHYAAVRARLADELDTQPGSALLDLHTAILRGQPPSDPTPGTDPSPVRAGQLPAAVPGFTGRRAELDRLDTWMDHAEGPATAVVVSAVSGNPGVGKTALAVRWAHRVRRRFPDGQLYLNLRGFDPAGDPIGTEEAVRSLLDALDVPPERIPPTVDGQLGLYRSILADRRMLILLDNARDAGQVRPLMPGTSDCLALVTSRDQLLGLAATAAAHLINLDVFSDAEALDLLTRRLGAARVAAEPSATEAIVAACGRLPLALAVVAARAAARPDTTLAALAAELADSRRRLDTLTPGGGAVTAVSDVRAVFSWSYRTLGTDAARLFRLLGLHPGPDIGTEAAASLAGVPVAGARSSLAELTRANLIREPTLGRFTLHDLLRDYATELAHGQDGDADRADAVVRMLDHYVHTGCAAARVLHPHRPPLDEPPAAPGVTAEAFDDRGPAAAWFAREFPTLLGLLRRAVEGGFDAHVWRLAWACSPYVTRQRMWRDALALQEAGIEAAGRLGDRPAVALAHRTASCALLSLGRFDAAGEHLHRALEMFEALDDDTGRAYTHQVMALSYEHQGRPREALDEARRGLELQRRAGDRAGQAEALNAVGWCLSLVGEHEDALVHCRQALALHRDLGSRHGEADTWHSIGAAHRNLGQSELALDAYGRALSLYREFGERYLVANTRAAMGDAESALGRADAARAAWREALDILTDIDHPEAADVRQRLAGAG
jgi:DNA-binding SARP family transcriptional activator/Tfp pilus assembly protein PilF